jgi:hypothetical protein
MITLDQIFEFGTSIIFFIVGIWATAFSYGFVGDRLVGGLRWNVGFKRPLRWLGPLLVAFCIASFFVIFRE